MIIQAAASPLRVVGSVAPTGDMVTVEYPPADLRLMSRPVGGAPAQIDRAARTDSRRAWNAWRSPGHSEGEYAGGAASGAVTLLTAKCEINGAAQIISGSRSGLDPDFLREVGAAWSVLARVKISQIQIRSEQGRGI